MRMPVRREMSSSLSCRPEAAPPSSAKPEAMIITLRTPTRAHSSTTSTTSFRRNDDHRQIDRLADRGDGRIGLVARDLLVRRIDRIELAGKLVLDDEVHQPAADGVLLGRGADKGDGFRPEEIGGQGAVGGGRLRLHGLVQGPSSRMHSLAACGDRTAGRSHTSIAAQRRPAARCGRSILQNGVSLFRHSGTRRSKSAVADLDNLMGRTRINPISGARAQIHNPSVSLICRDCRKDTNSEYDH